MKWHATIFLCLVGTLSANGALTATEVPLTIEEIGITGTPVTNELVEAGLRNNREALRALPGFQTNDAPTHLRLAEVLSQQGDPHGAIEEYQAAIQLNFEMAEAFRGLGAVYIDTHEWKKAEQALRKGVELNPQDHQAWYWLGRSLIAQEHVQRAQEAFEIATHIAPTDAETHSDLGLAFMAQGHIHEAEKALKNAIKLQPDLAEAHHRLERVRAAGDNSQDLIQSARNILQTLFHRE